MTGSESDASNDFQTANAGEVTKKDGNKFNAEIAGKEKWKRYR